MCQCENGTNTNSDPLYVAPASAGPRTNTFDWRERPLPVRKPGYEQFAPLGIYEFTNPYYSTSQHLEAIAAGANSDFQPQDGWELIKQDFGYLYKATNAGNPNVGTWNGEVNVGNNFTSKPLAYFMLYNKYSTTLRILASTPIQGQISEDRIQVKLNLVAKDAYSEYDNKPNLNDLRTNGIFANATPISTPLDQRTNNLELSAFAVFPSTISEFFYADFLLGYDPCICFFKSAINVSFYTELTAQIKLSGQLVGINRNISDVNAGSEGAAINNFKSSFFFDKLNNPKGIRQTYESIEDLKAEFNSNPAAKDAAELMGKFLKGAVIAGSLKIGPSGLKQFKEKGFEKISPFVDFFSGMAKEGKTEPTVLTANMEIAGKLTQSNERAGYDFRFAVPGSLGSQQNDEYNKQNNALGTKPYFPMYNEVPGLFALLETPTLQYKFGGISSQVPRYACGSGGSQLCTSTKDITSYYKLNGNPIKYSLSPLVDMDKTIIEAAFEIVDVPNGLGYSPYEVLTNINYVSDTEEMYYALDNGNTDPPLSNDPFAKGTYRKIRTEFFPIGCLNNLVAKTVLDFDGLEQSWKRKFVMQKAYIIINAYVFFKKDIYGRDHFTFQSFKFPLIWERTNDEIQNLPGLNGFNFPDYVEQGNVAPFLIPVPKLSKIQTTLKNGIASKISFGGGPGNYDISSAQNIVVENSYEIRPGITLQIIDFDELVCKNSINAINLQGLALQEYCQNSQYKANTAVSRISLDNHTIQIKKSISLLGYPIPNPTSGECNLSFDLAEEGGYEMYLSNSIGVRVKDLQKSDFARSGSYKVNFQTNDLEAGVYYITFSSNGFRQARKLVVVK
jgi:hypothetical protein